MTARYCCGLLSIRWYVC